MALPRFIRKWFFSRNRGVGKSKFPLKVEKLEDRTVPSLTIADVHGGLNIIGKGAPASSPPSTAFTPIQITDAYGLTTGLTSSAAVSRIKFNGSTVAYSNLGAGQTIAIVDPFDDPNIASDLTHFDTQFGLPAPPSLTIVNQTGGTTLPATDPTGEAEIEVSIDVEWAHAIAPAAKIVLVEANSTALTDLFTAVQTAASLPGVSVVSMSFTAINGAGLPTEFGGENAFDANGSTPVFVTPTGHQGVTFLGATGDFGAPGGYPAYSPNVVAVGGTRLVINTTSSGYGYSSETGWGYGAGSSILGGSGGGESYGYGSGSGLYEKEPSYQTSVQNTGLRTIPDVSMVADPTTGVAIYDSFTGTNVGGGSANPWYQYGGTSLATPMWGGIISIINQGRAIYGESSLTSDQTLVKLYKLPANAFHDIIGGSNGGFTAIRGYDEVTGRGSPVSNILIPDMARADAKVVFLTQPNNIQAGGVLNPITVQLEDSSGNPVKESGITVTITSVPLGSLTGTLTATTNSNGQATFKNLSQGVPGTYELEAIVAGDTPGFSHSFVVAGSSIRRRWR
jgi:subtilase family serine protease